MEKLDFTSPEMLEYAMMVQTTLVALLENVDVQSSGAFPPFRPGPGYGPDDSIFGGGNGFKGDIKPIETIGDNSTNQTDSSIM